MPLVTALLALALAASEPSPAEEARARRTALREELGPDAVAVVFAGVAGGEGPFRPQNDFRYLTGLVEPEAALLLEPGNDEQPEVLYLKPRDKAGERWSGETLGPGDLDPATGEPDPERKRTMAATGFAAVRARAALEGDLARALGRGRELWVASEPVPLSRPLTPELALVRDLRDRRPGLQVKALGAKVASLRAIKSAGELAAMERAIAITLEAQRSVAGAIRPGIHEYEVKALLEYVFKRSGATGIAFPSIVGSGPNATVLHYEGDRREMAAGDLVVVDIGAEVEGYAADVTRTFPVGGKFSPEQRKVYDIVLQAQAAALAEVKPGARLRSDVHKAAKKVIEEAGYKSFFPHGTSHYVGLEVHDVGERDGVLKPGMVITVEPGIYLPDQALGVRIEDEVLVTRDGHRVLTEALPRTAAEVEALMAARRGDGAPGEPAE